MTDQKDKLVTNKPNTGMIPKLTRSLPGGGLHARLRNPKAVVASDPLTRPNRLALMLDVSGSMYGDKIISLREAATGFVNACNFSDTAIALEPFGEHPVVNRVDLTTQQMMLVTTIQMLRDSGGTPMAEAMDYCLNTYSISRGVIVSDGQPDRETMVYEQARNYAEAGIPIDCVHIGLGGDGEECLKKVADITGGIFIKFTDITAFSKSFKYLTPGFRALLTTGAVTPAQLGAKEIK